MRFAPILQAVAVRVSGSPQELRRTDPVRWAYALRDAVALAEPDVVVSHLDPRLEADALLAVAAEREGDWVDRVLAAPALAQLAPVRETVELVRTLAGLYGGGPPIAATVSGPATVAARLAPDLLGVGASEDELLELADLAADALAGLVGAYAEAGAQTVIVVEHDHGGLAPVDVEQAHLPLVRTLTHHRVEGLLATPPDSPLVVGGYGSVRLEEIPADIELAELRMACVG